MTEWNIETALNHHAGCSVYDDGACTCGFRARREQIGRRRAVPAAFGHDGKVSGEES